MVLLITLIGARTQQPLTVVDDGLCSYILFDCHSRDSYQQNDTQTLQNEKPRQLVDYDAAQNRNVRLPVCPLYQLADLSQLPF